jgi:hypothetical protein
MNFGVKSTHIIHERDDMDVGLFDDRGVRLTNFLGTIGLLKGLLRFAVCLKGANIFV